MMTEYRDRIAKGLAITTAVIMMMYAHPVRAACESSFYRSKSTSTSLGDYDKLWGYVYGKAYVSGQDYTSGDRIDASGQVTADVRIFGVRKQVVNSVAGAYSYYGNSVGGAIDVYVLGVNMYHQAWSAPLSRTYTRTQTFFSADQWFFPGGIPVHVTETAAGEAGIQVSGGPTTTGVAVDIKPWARSYATGAASVDILVAAFGVTASVDLVRLDVPSHGELYLSSNHLDWSLRVDRVLSTLHGRAWVWAKALFGLITYEQDIINWSGSSSTVNLYNAASFTDLCPPTGGGGPI